MKEQKDINKERYDRLREEHRCLWCGKPLDREGSLCVSCNEKGKKRTKANKKYYLQIGICPTCRKRKVSPGYKSCLPCREAKRLSRRNGANPEQYERTLEQKRAKRVFRAENGLCTVCGKPNREAGEWHTCPECRKKQRDYRKMYVLKNQLPDRALWKDQGRCSRCGADEQYNGFTLCRKCYEQSAVALEKARAVVFKHRADERAKQEAIEAERIRETKRMFHPRTMIERRKTNDKEGSEKE